MIIVESYFVEDNSKTRLDCAKPNKTAMKLQKTKVPLNLNNFNRYWSWNNRRIFRYFPVREMYIIKRAFFFLFIRQKLKMRNSLDQFVPYVCRKLISSNIYTFRHFSIKSAELQKYFHFQICFLKTFSKMVAKELLKNCIV